MTAACEAFPDWHGPPMCGKPAIGRYRVGCVHEHIREAFVCAECADEIGRGDGWVCIPCAESCELHECPVTPEFIPATDAELGAYDMAPGQ